MGMISGSSVGLTRPRSGMGTISGAGEGGGGRAMAMLAARSKRMTEVVMASEIVAPTEVQWQL